MQDKIEPLRLAEQLICCRNIAEPDEAFASAFADLSRAADWFHAEKYGSDEDAPLSVGIRGIIQLLVEDYGANCICRIANELEQNDD